MLRSINANSASLYRVGDEYPQRSTPALNEYDIQDGPASPPSVQKTSSPGETKTSPQNVQVEAVECFLTRIERLGRERPKVFTNSVAEMAFCFSVCMSQILVEYFVSGFNVILPTLVTEFNIPSPSRVWPASAFSLVVASTLLPFGRLADMYGGYVVYVSGFGWLALWSLVAGFSKTALILDLCRALQGLGSAAFLPSSVMLMGRIYRPGPRKNLVFSIYGACAVVGVFFGIFFAGLVGQFSRWEYYFWIGAILASITTITAYFSIPSDMAEKRKQKIPMDWWGTPLLVTGLVLIVFAVTDSSHAPQKWKTPYIATSLAVGCVILGVAMYVEGWKAERPVLPFDLFRVTYMKPLTFALLLNYGTLGVFLLYTAEFFQNFMGASPLQVVAWYCPLITGGLIFSTAGGFVLHLIPGTALLLFSGAGWVGATLLMALMPEGANYWAFVFPSMIFGTIGIDITFTVTNIFITTSLPDARQGLAGALINSILHLGIALMLGFADIIQTETSSLGLRSSYQNVFWLSVASTSTALLIMIFFIKINKAKSDLTADERIADQRGDPIN
ncbi:MAG: hypothetical protein Q9227_006401 [Pyrenula ochraceoflavens]